MFLRQWPLLFLKGGQGLLGACCTVAGYLPSYLACCCLACLPTPVTCDLDTYQAYQTYGIPVHGQWEWEKR